MNTTLLIGATSAMAEHAARRFAADGDRLLLAARDPQRLETIAADLRLRGASAVDTLPPFDAASPAGLRDLLHAITQWEGPLDRILLAHGLLPDQTTCETDADAAAQSLEINFLSVVRLCTPLANRLADQGHGTLAVIGSVAGLRGRQSNYLYGAAKGGLHLYLQGLRNRLHPQGVRVITLLPGFIDTPMTAAFDKGPLFVSADTAGRLIHRALVRGKSDIVYLPFYWRFILWIIRAIPEPLFKRMKL